MSIQISKMLKILKKIKIDHFRAKTRKKNIFKIYFFCKMLIFQDFLKMNKNSKRSSSVWLVKLYYNHSKNRNFANFSAK